MSLLTFDIGGTFIKYALADESCTLSGKGKVPTPQTSREALIETLSAIYIKSAENAQLDGIAVSMPGIIDSERGYVYMGGALEYNNGFAIRDALSEKCRITKISVNNDAKCAAQAEASLGALSDVKDGAVIIFGTMVGGGIVLNGKVRNGSHFAAGETSYILADRSCDPGYDTVWGRTCSALRINREFAAVKGLDSKSVGGEAVFEAVERRDADALDILDRYTKEIAVKLFNLQTVLDLERIAIGGGVSAQPIFIEYIKKHLDRMYSVSPYYVPRCEIVRCRFGNDANLIGASQYWKNSFEFPD
ncbi:MAG: ROK family protein [Eubacteriales bacterium]|nr:ROK family protein [Eubacteriales bacterium]